jgi:leader peptidase (prepilin peptidase)/N-methyltransferase
VTWALLALLGLAFGSFLNVCIWRIPRGQSIVSPPSHCPRCRKPIQPWDNVPVLSYLLLSGRCRYCRKPISIRYPLVEALTAGLFIAAYARFGWSAASIKACVFVCLLVVTALIDLDLQIIPFRLSIAGLGLGLTGALVAPPPSFMEALTAAAAGAAFIGFAWLLWRYVLAALFRRLGIDRKEGMGVGDLPYAAMIGAFIGLRPLAVALFAAVVAGVVVGFATRLLGKSEAGQPMSFGPFLAFGALVGVFWGPVVFAWYAAYAGLAH